ncbi:MAG TPA: DUF4173 domain-containing protein [Nocardioidaceae bacterium]|nr:DUF4173 domain-containing protein [Nocardioidaceae bacterium]
MSNPAMGASPALAARPVLDASFGDLWPDEQAGAPTAGRPRLVAAALGVGALAAVVVPFRDFGLGTFMVLTAVCGVVAVAARERFTARMLGSGALCLLLAATLLVRDAEWIVALCLVATFAVGSAALADGRSIIGLVASTAAVPLAALRGLPWLGRSLTVTGRPATWWPVLRTTALSVVLVLVFGGLFASADAVFARWVGELVPDLTFTSLFVRLFVLGAVFGLTATGVYVALVPPRVERLALPAGRTVRRFEWIVPVGLVTATFAVFLVAQLTALFGGHDYLRRTTGLTYAAYVHEGFGQLTLATALTLAVVATTVRHAPRDTGTDRLLLRVTLGLLCLLTLVVVASALSRMHVYEQAYGFTRLRLLVSVFEGWLGAVVALVLVAGITLRGGWLPRTALLTGAVLLLGLAAADPDRYIAAQNIDRFEQTGRIDWSYLAGLSDDAVPAFEALPARYRPCVLGHRPATADDDWLEWNLGRSRAQSRSTATASTSTSWCG